MTDRTIGYYLVLGAVLGLLLGALGNGWYQAERHWQARLADEQRRHQETYWHGVTIAEALRLAEPDVVKQAGAKAQAVHNVLKAERERAKEKGQTP